MKQNGTLTLRTCLNIITPFEVRGATLEDAGGKLAALGVTTGHGDQWIKVGALETNVDGGILSGTAYMNQSWGEKAAGISGVSEPGYRGTLMLGEDDLYVFARAGAGAGWRVTAHCAGDTGPAYRFQQRALKLRNR